MKRILTFLTLLIMITAGCSQVTAIGPGSVYEPEEDERRLWAASRAEFEKLKISGVLYDDAKLEAYVNGVMNRMLGGHRKAYLPLEPRVYLDSVAWIVFRE